LPRSPAHSSLTQGGGGASFLNALLGFVSHPCSHPRPFFLQVCGQILAKCFLRNRG
jgi:hypothetical protein